MTFGLSQRTFVLDDFQTGADWEHGSGGDGSRGLSLLLLLDLLLLLLLGV